MKHASTFYRVTIVGLFSAAALLGFSCVDKSNPPPSIPGLPQVLTEVEKACASDIFRYGRPISFSDLQNSGLAKYTLESVYYRDVISRSPNEVELAYRVEMQMRPHGRTIVPEHHLACREMNNPSARTMRMSRTTLPVLGDLHLPSTRITIFDRSENGGSEDRDRLYNFPRISEFSVSSDDYFSFGQNPSAYRRLRTLGEYIELLRYRSLFPRVELREMGYGRIGIYAEKDYAGERAQFLIVLAERNR